MKNSKITRLELIYVLVIISLATLAYGTGIPYTPSPAQDYLVDGYDSLPFKDQRGDESWSLNINTNYEPDRNWDTNFYDNAGGSISYKCLSYASSTTNDWFNLQYGIPMNNYRSYISGRYENGTNPRFLEANYHESINGNHYSYTPLLYKLKVISAYRDPITNERIPYRLKGYADTLTNPPSDWINYDDPKLSNPQEFNYTYQEDLFNIGEFKEISIDLEIFRGTDDENRLKEAMEKYGALLSFTENLESSINIHSMALVGHGEDGSGTYFIAHDNYGSGGSGGYSEYKKLYIEDIDQAFAFIPKGDWPTYHHDNRRTGFTLLKGDMEKGKTQRKAINLVLGTRGTTAALARPSIANLDNDNYQDVVVGYLVDDEDDGWISAVGKNWWGNTKEKWKKNIGYKVLANPSIGNLDDDKELEVIVGLYNGTLILIDPDGSKDPYMTGYTVDKKYSAIGGSDVRGRLGFTAIANLDNEGRNEIIFADNSYNYDWNGTLYVLGYEGNNLVEKDMINLTEGIGGADGGAHGAVAIADVDNDDKEEIVVPGFYGIKVYDYDSGTLSLKCNNTHSYISAAPVIYDIDRDNEYEIIYTTADYDCDYGGCSNNLYVIDADSCTEEKTKSLDIYSLVSPAIANFDSDSNLEIIILGRTAEYGDYDEVQLFEYGSSITEEWTYPKSGSIQLVDSAPNIVDIDGDGDYEIIIASTTSSIMILNNTGEIFDEFDVEGTIGSTPVIGDLSGKGVAELTVKRSGSPVNILTTLTGTNRMPELNQIGDITAIAGDLININASGQVAATDPDGDNTTIYYSSPLNESGLWQTTVNDTGNYSILVEASDGNLSDYQYVDITVFSNETTLSNTFADNTTKKLLNFTGTENKTITIRLPKDAWVIHTKMKVEGMAP